MTVLAFPPRGRPLAPFTLDRVTRHGDLTGLTYSRQHRMMVLVTVPPPDGMGTAEAVAAVAAGRAWFDPGRWALVVR